MTSELIVQVGLFGFGITGVLTIVVIAFLGKKKKSLEETLDSEYGARREHS